jgi:DNA topoisomerase-1
MFSPPYIPHKIPILYKGQKIVLKEDAEEYATIFSRYIDTEYYKLDKFKKNFFKEKLIIQYDCQLNYFAK